MALTMKIPGALLCAAALAAGLARAAGSADDQKFYYEDIFTPFFAPDAHDPSRYSTQRPDAVPSSFVMPKPAGTFRVFVIGGSIAGIFMGYSRGLADTLAAALPSRRVEILP